MESDNPFEIFGAWFVEAQTSEANDPNAMALSTVRADGQPSVRMVLLKGHGPEGFVFYTNDGSRKAEELAQNPQAALLFHWKSLRRQVRIEGKVGAVDEATADAYFATRSRDSQLGAWASYQSRPLDNRETFERLVRVMQKRFDGQDVPRPPFWSGYRLAPKVFEFWQDREHRLHERWVYAFNGISWSKGMIYP